MKTLKLLTVLLFVIIQVNAQNTERVAFRAYSGEWRTTEHPEWDVKDVNLVIMIDFETNKITIDNSFEDVFHIRAWGETQKNVVDSDGDTYTYHVVSVYDKDYIECSIVIATWDDYDYARIGVMYPNIEYVYSCRKLQ